MAYADPATGLTTAQVAERVAAGQVNDAPDPRSRSIWDILRANTFTWFNALIAMLWVIMIIVAPWQDSLFGLVIVFNAAIGTIQEYRAARTLSRLSVIGEARPMVRRDGVDAEIRPPEVVLGDIIVLRTGDQLVVDGVVLQSDGLEIDESLLTGEADPVDKGSGAEAFSGSFVVAGSGVYVATKVGRDSFASSLTAQAKVFSQTRSELREAVARFIRVVSYLLIPVGVLLIWSQLSSDLDIREAIRGSVAGVVTMVPEGLVLLTSIAMAVSVIRLAQRKVLVQDMPAVEVLARVDTVCVDKTGTLTQPGMQVQQRVLIDGSLIKESTVDAALGALGASEDSPNPTLQAVASAYPSPGWTVSDTVPFSSARKWSAATFTDHGTWVMGAPEMLVQGPLAQRADELAAGGARVLLLARAAEGSSPSAEGGARDLVPAAFVVIDQQLRPDAAETVAYFLDQDVQVKVISGDNAATVGAIASQAGVPHADAPLDARTLPEDPEQMAQVVAEHGVFGRVTPLQKQAMVDALHRRDRTVAMTGDGVNDVLALKSADLGISMGSGSPATRAVAQLVLLDNKFSVMPRVVAEGRRVLGNIERVSDVFLTKSFYAICISITTAILAFFIADFAFPFLPRHLTLISSLTIGIPGFFLALMPNKERFRPGFFRRVVLFAAPAGVICAAASLTSYAVALQVGDSRAEAMSAAATTLFIVAWVVLLQSARPLNLLRILIVGVMGAAYLGVLFIPWFSEFFELAFPGGAAGTVCLISGGVGGLLIWAATVVTDRWRRH